MTTAIDVSLLPPPQAIKPLDYEAIVTERLVSVQSRFEGAGLAWDVGTLETDPAVILQQEDAFRELLDKGAINDAVRAVLPAFSQATDLDHLVAFAGILRVVVTPADPVAGTAAVPESDAALLARYLVSFSEPAASSGPAYQSRCLRAAPGLAQVTVEHAGAGKVLIHLLSPGGVPTPMATVLKVALALQAEDASGLTDDVSVRAATVVPYSVTLTLQIPRGPSPDLVRDEALSAVRAVGLSRYRIGGSLPANAVTAAAYVPNVSRVVAPGLVDVPPGRGVAPWLADLTIAVEVLS